MATFIMCGQYSGEAVKHISAARTDQAISLIKQFGGEVKAMYALLGETDLILILDLPGVAEAMKVSVALGQATGIAFTTSPAVSVAEFDKLMAEV